MELDKLGSRDPKVPVMSPMFAYERGIKRNRIWKLITVIMLFLAVGGVGVGVYAVMQSDEKDSQIRVLKAEVRFLEEELDRLQNPENYQDGGDDTTTVVDNNISGIGYLEPAGWDVRFAYPEGVSEVQYDLSRQFDGSIYVTSITSNGITYDMNVCGGAESYHDFMFSLGWINRWNPNISHESTGELQPDTYTTAGLTRLGLVDNTGTYQYYIGKPDVGFMCVTGDNPEYAEAVRLTEALLNSIEIK